MNQNDKRSKNTANMDLPAGNSTDQTASSFQDAAPSGADCDENQDPTENGVMQSEAAQTDRKKEEDWNTRQSGQKTGGRDSETCSLSCAVIRDLLPVYADGLASAESRKIIEMHLEGCADCRKICKAMKETNEMPYEKEAPVVDGLKKIRSRSRKQKTWLWFLAICGLILGMVCYSLVNQASQVPRMLMDIQVVPETKTRMQVKISSLSPTTGFLQGKSYEEKDGEISIRVQGGEGILNRTSSLSIPVSSKTPIETVFCNGSLIWQDGTFIEQTTSELYALKDGYAGDVSRAGELMKLLQISLPASGFQLAMDTEDEQNCRWTFALEKRNTVTRWELEKNAYRLRCDAWLMMLLTPNLKEVCFTASPLIDGDEIQINGKEKEGDSSGQSEDIRVLRSELEPVLRDKGLPVTVQTPADLQTIRNAMAG